MNGLKQSAARPYYISEFEQRSEPGKKTEKQPTAQTNSVNLRKSISSTPCWFIGRVELDKTNLKLWGWALPFGDDPTNATLVCDGVPFDSFQRKYDEHFGVLFDHVPNAAFSRFEAVRNFASEEPFEDEGHKEISYVNGITLKPFNRWSNVLVPNSNDGITLPNSQSMERTQATSVPEQYTVYGFTLSRMLARAIDLYARDLDPFSANILDWGCGCARVTQHVKLRYKEANVVGVDVDSENISWCTESLPSITFEKVGLYPPMEFESESFDIIYGISVLTHLTLDATRAWIEELSRVAKRHAIIMLSVHAETSLARVKNEDVVRKTLDRGFCDDIIDHRLDGYIDDDTYYRSTYCTTIGITEIFAPHFSVLDVLEAANAPFQDVFVLRKK